MREVRTALLEADVHYDIVSAFCEDVVQRALGQQVLSSLKPGQQMIGIVNEALVDLMKQGDSDNTGVPRVSPSPTIIMMCGLQGSGKTTTCGKLAAHLKKRGRSSMLVAADLQRPAAIEQLGIVASTVNDEAAGGTAVTFYSEPERADEYGKAVGVAVGVCQRAVAHARKEGIDTVILDTAGRLHINDDLMTELRGIHTAVQPHQIYLVIDAMTGQDAVNSAKAFHEQLQIDGAILSKFDSDTRGGAALTVRKVTGAPIRFIGTGESFDKLEEFHAERIASRILGMGDVVSLVERAQEEVSEEEAEAMAAKMAKGEFTMDDFLKQMRTLRRMGSMKSLLGMLPGVGSQLKDLDIDDKQLDRVEGMVNSMTQAERNDVSGLNQSRRKRISRGSGTSTEEVSRLTKQFGMLSKMTKQMSGMGARGKASAMRQMQSAGGGMGMGMGGMAGFGKPKGSTKSRSPKRKKKRR